MQTRWGDLTVADGHVHFFSHRFFDLLGGKTLAFDEMQSRLGWTMPPADPVELARAWTAELDRHGVARAALIASIPGDEASVLAAAQAFPGRFYAYAMLNPAAPGAAIAEGLDGVCLFPAMHHYSICSPGLNPIWEQAAARKCVVFVHGGMLTVGVREKLGLPSLFDMRFSNPLDLHAVAVRFPKVRFVVPHFGAGYFREALMLATLCPNVSLDTSSSNSWMRFEGLDLKTVFHRALQVLGPERLIFGSDSSFFPRGWVSDIFQAQQQVLVDLELSADAARLIFCDNLQRLFS